MPHCAPVWSLVASAASAFGVVAVAELGDKTQLLALGFGARHRLRTVAVGLAIGYGVAGALAAIVGGLLGATLPERPIAVGAGVLFLVFGALTLLRPDTGERERVVRTGAVVLSIAATIALAEMGDKTQLATAALAARWNPVAVWVGATLGAVAAGMVGAVAGRRLGARLDERTLRVASAITFAVFGLALLATA